MQNKTLIFKKAFHLTYFLFLSILIIWDRIVNIPKFPYCFCYLTQIDLYLNTLYYFLSLIQDFISPKSKSLDKYFNFCFSLSFCVFMMFWGLFFFNRNTLFKQSIELSYTLVFLFHGGVFFICLIEQLYSNPRQRPLYFNKLYYFVFTFCYCLFLKLIYSAYNIKVYPFVYGKLYLFIIICIVGGLVTLIGHYLYYFITTRMQLNDTKDNFNDRNGKELKGEEDKL